MCFEVLVELPTGIAPEVEGWQFVDATDPPPTASGSRWLSVTDGHCGCAFVRYDDGGERIRRRGRRKGWPDARIERAVSAHATSTDRGGMREARRLADWLRAGSPDRAAPRLFIRWAADPTHDRPSMVRLEESALSDLASLPRDAILEFSPE